MDKIHKIVRWKPGHIIVYFNNGSYAFSCSIDAVVWHKPHNRDCPNLRTD